MDESMEPHVKHDSYCHMESFDSASQPEVNENMMYGED